MRYVPFLVLAVCGSCTNGEALSQRPFLQMGVIEGFYGPPWSHQDRLDVLRFMGRVGLSHYYYAPKDDPFHRAQWREPYPEDELAKLGELVAVAEESGVAFVYAISPGGSIVYADPDEYATLREKLRAIEALGVRDFALFVDDVPPTLQHQEDREAFETLADAHASVINRLYRDLAAGGGTLAATPTTYANAWGDREYLRHLGELVVPEVPFFWTGIDVASPEFTAEQAAEWASLMSRDPLIWDNYPVNDYARWRLFLGPLGGRAADLSSHVLGILSNPMNEAHASMLPLATLAEYARDPQSYDSLVAHRRALGQLYGDDVAEILGPFVSIYGDYGWETNLFEPLFIPGDTIDVDSVRSGLTQLVTSLTRLDSVAAVRPEVQPLADELRPFVTRTMSRLEALQADPRYETLDGQLAFRAELDQITVTAGPAVIMDGNLTEWSDVSWTLLHGTGSGVPPRTAARSDAEFLYVALRVPHVPRTVNPAPRIGEGDHVALVLQAGSSTPRKYLTSEDVIVLLSPPTDQTETTVLVQSMAFHGFMAKWLADNRNLRFSEFHVSTFGSEPPISQSISAVGRTSSDGYTMEIAVPRLGRAELRLSLTVVATVGGQRQFYSLAQRNYPANPATFAELTFR